MNIWCISFPFHCSTILYTAPDCRVDDGVVVVVVGGGEEEEEEDERPTALLGEGYLETPSHGRWRWWWWRHEPNVCVCPIHNNNNESSKRSNNWWQRSTHTRIARLVCVLLEAGRGEQRACIHILYSLDPRRGSRDRILEGGFSSSAISYSPANLYPHCTRTPNSGTPN